MSEPEEESLAAVIVTHRSADDLRQLLPELQPLVDELVIVDNASDDGSAEVAEALAPGAIVIRRSDNSGFAAGANEGVRASIASHVLLLNPDVRIDRASLDELRAGARRHPGSIVGPVVRYPDGRVQLTRSGPPNMWTLAGEHGLIPESAQPESWPARWWLKWASYEEEDCLGALSGCCLLLPRSVWERVGSFDERFFLYWEEVDWQARARERGVSTWLIPSSVVHHALGGSTGRHDVRRARMFASSARAFVDKWVPRRRRPLALTILIMGQAVRWLVWSTLQRPRSEASERRAFHAEQIRQLLFR